jgi:hypothetical protein
MPLQQAKEKLEANNLRKADLIQKEFAESIYRKN